MLLLFLHQYKKRDPQLLLFFMAKAFMKYLHMKWGVYSNSQFVKLKEMPIYFTDRVYDVLMRIKSGSLPYTELKILPHADIKKSLHTAGTTAGIGHVHMHMLRHTFATLMRDEGVPLDRIMEALGHSSMDMVLGMPRHGLSS